MTITSIFLSRGWLTHSLLDAPSVQRGALSDSRAPCAIAGTATAVGSSPQLEHDVMYGVPATTRSQLPRARPSREHG